MSAAATEPIMSAGGGGDVEMGNAAPLELNLPPDPETGKGLLKPIPETTPMERVAGTVAVAAVTTALVAMVIEGSAVVIVGGVLSAIVGPYAYWQQVQLTDIKALQETQRAIKAEVDKLAAENKRLARNIDNLSESVQNLKDVEDALTVITKTQGQSVEAFRKQVEDNKEILKGMQSNLKANILQNLLSLVLGSDTNQDMVVNEHEVDDLIRRIGNMSGVQVQEDKFREAISGKEVSAVMDIIKNLLREDLPEEEKIFIITQ